MCVFPLLVSPWHTGGPINWKDILGVRWSRKTTAVITVTAGETWERTLQGKGTCHGHPSSQWRARTRTRSPGNQSSFHQLCQNTRMGTGWELAGRPTSLQPALPRNYSTVTPQQIEGTPLTLRVKEFRWGPRLRCQSPGVCSPLGSNRRPPQRLCHHFSVRFLAWRAQVLSSASQDLILTCQLLNQ